MRTEAEAAEILSQLEKVDILISHESPYHLIDSTRTHGGFHAITDYLIREKPALHLFGHHHISYRGRCGKTIERGVYLWESISTNDI